MRLTDSILKLGIGDVSRLKSKAPLQSAEQGLPSDRRTQELIAVAQDLGEGRLVVDDGRMLIVLKVEGFDDLDILSEDAERSLYARYYGWLRRTDEHVDWYVHTVPVAGDQESDPLREPFRRAREVAIRRSLNDWVCFLEDEVRYESTSYATVSLQMAPPTTGDAINPAVWMEALEMSVHRFTTELQALGARVTRLMGEELIRIVSDSFCVWDANSAGYHPSLEEV
jgi:hypothetical protein